jgi:hypothetical protein
MLRNTCAGLHPAKSHLEIGVLNQPLACDAAQSLRAVSQSFGFILQRNLDRLRRHHERDLRRTVQGLVICEFHFDFSPRN